LGRLFAVKISYLPADHQDVTEEMVESVRIFGENHPHILKLFAGEGSSIGGRLLLVMELANQSLLDRCRECRASGGAFPPAELNSYIRQAAEALDYIHGRELVHGGINPGDVLLLSNQVKIADPGPPVSPDWQFARIQLANLSKALCMAPERKRGDKHIQSDQYALAATYAWLRAGRPVLGLDSQAEEIRTVSSLSQLEQEVLIKALSPDPDHRYPSCTDFANALRVE
jgi:serine/threonine-protein kinase